MAGPLLFRPTPMRLRLQQLDLTLHLQARRVFDLVIRIVTPTLVVTWVLRMIFIFTFWSSSPSAISDSDLASEESKLFYPSFWTLDCLRRPFLCSQNYAVFSFCVTGVSRLSMRKMWESVDEKRNQLNVLKKQLADLKAGLVQDGEAEAKEDKEDEKEEEEEEEERKELSWEDISYTFYMPSWRGQDPLRAKQSTYPIDYYFSKSKVDQDTSTFPSLSSLSLVSEPPTSAFQRINSSARLSIRARAKEISKKRGSQLMEGLKIFLQISIPVIYMFCFKRALDQPPCRQFSELFSPETNILAVEITQKSDSFFPGSAVKIQEDGLVVLNGTLVYTQPMDRALYTICMMEGGAFLGVGILGFLLAYQLLVRLYWAGVREYRIGGWRRSPKVAA